MITLKQKIFLVFFGLCVFLLLSEVSLRIAGNIYYGYRIKNASPHLDNRNEIRILCIGDSFTFGIGAPKGFSYPEQLEKMLNADGADLKFIVYNGAIPGYNSSQLSRHFEEFMQKFNPDIVAVMIGINNKNVPLESNYFLFSNGGIKNQIYKFDYFLSRLRSYKLLKFAIGKLKKNIQFRKKKIKEDIFIVKKLTTGNSAEFERFIKLGNDYFDKREATLAKEAFQNAIALNPNDEKGYLGLARVFIHFLDKCELGIEQLNKALKIDPHNSETFDSLWQANYRLGRNKEAQEAIVKYISLNPQDKESGMRLSHLLSRGLPNIKDTETFDKLLRYELENIVKSAKRTGLKIILQDYPSLFRGNKIIEDVATKLEVPFVDNESVFEELISKNGLDWKSPNYFVEDGHCNTNGYRIMAENLYKAVKSELERL